MVDTATIATIFAASAASSATAFWAHGRLAGESGRPGAASMAAFVVGWLAMLTALLTGIFLITLLAGG